MPSFASESQTSSPLKFIIIAVAGLAVAAAGYFAFVRGGSASGQDDSSASAASYMCLTDSKVFTLTPAEFQKKLTAGEVQSMSEDGSRGGVTKVKCPQCNQIAAVLVVKCPKDATLIPLRDKSGQPGKCPKCGASALDISAATR